MKIIILLVLALFMSGCSVIETKLNNDRDVALASIQPDPAQTVAGKVGEAGIEEESTADGSNSKNATVQQQYGGATTRTTAVVNQLVPDKNGLMVEKAVLRINRTTAQTGTDLNFTYDDGKGKIITFGKGTVTADGETNRALSSDSRDQQLDTQVTARTGLTEGAALQESVDNPAVKNTEAELEATKARLDAVKSIIPDVVGKAVDAVVPG